MEWGRRRIHPSAKHFPNFSVQEKSPKWEGGPFCFFHRCLSIFSREKGGKKSVLSWVSCHFTLFPTLFFSKRHFPAFLIISCSHQKCRLLLSITLRNSAAISTLKQRQQHRQQQLRNRHTFFAFPQKNLLFSAIYFSAHSNTSDSPGRFYTSPATESETCLLLPPLSSQGFISPFSQLTLFGGAADAKKEALVHKEGGGGGDPFARREQERYGKLGRRGGGELG